VRLTDHHNPEPGDHAGALLCDADLSVLGGDEQSYARYVAAVREDYAQVSDDDFAKGRAAVVRHLLALDPLFHSDRAKALWLEQARRNLMAELG
jgi:predicted metal-dependent HD superfamily phosphohydrolase